MTELTSFWSGALTVGAREDLYALASRVGGAERLVTGGVDALVAAGLPVHVARAWCAAPPLRSRWRALPYGTPGYPEHLAAIPSPPPVLFFEGDPEALARPGVAMVGTRACTGYGAGVARHLATELARSGAVVVSGLARGVDAHAHGAALRAGRTVAVLGHGLDTTAPPSNLRLRQAIVDNAGAIVSTFVDDVQPARWTFPARNRWIAALSRAVVVVEAPHRSGALITAKHALELGRDVWAVPGPITSTASAGCLDLIASGALVVTGVRDVVQSLCGLVAPSPEAWLALLLDGAPLEQVCVASGRPMAELLARVSRLELDGALVRTPDGRYAPGGSVDQCTKT